jgi:GNAT superfamily N-acetyltransferase
MHDTSIESPLHIRAATPDDAAVVFAFIVELARFEQMEERVQREGGVDRLREHLSMTPPACEVLLAELGGEPAGFALHYPVYSTFLTRRCLHLEDLFVSPGHRGKGIGEALLRAVAGVARDRGAWRLQWCVLDWNEGAIRFYERMGARVMPAWRVCMVEGQAAIDALADGGSATG